GLATASKCGLCPTASGSGASGCNTCHNLAACYAKPWTDTIFGTKKHRAEQVSLALSPKTFTNQKCRVKKSSFTLQAVAATRAQPPYCVHGSSLRYRTRLPWCAITTKGYLTSCLTFPTSPCTGVYPSWAP